MSGVIDGQAVSAGVTNPAFLIKNADDTTINKIGLANTDPVSGPSITNIQREHNSIASFVGKAINALKDVLPIWVSGHAGTVNDTLFARAEALTAKFDPATGHTHSGAAGQGPKIGAGKLYSFASDAAFVSDKGAAAAQGDIYFNTTESTVRFHNGTAWVVVAGTEVPFTFANNQSSAADVTALAFSSSSYKRAHVQFSIGRKTSTTKQNAIVDLYISYDVTGTAWEIASQVEHTGGDPSGVTFEITSGGQVRYTSDNMSSGTGYTGTSSWRIVSLFAN